MHKFFVPIENFQGNYATIQGEDVKHIYKVLRLQEGEKVYINNCQGEEFLGSIVTIDKKEVQVKIIEKNDINNEMPINIYLLQGLPKASKMDLIVQKATELGIKQVVPVITERVIIKNELGEYKKKDRWNRIALEACKQCKRSLIPEVLSPVNLKEYLNQEKKFDIIVVPYENAEGYGIKSMINSIKEKDKIKNVAIIIGPEGGFEEEEIVFLKELGAHIVTLGPRILRTETAGFISASLLAYELGDIGGII